MCIIYLDWFGVTKAIKFSKEQVNKEEVHTWKHQAEEPLHNKLHHNHKVEEEVCLAECLAEVNNKPYNKLQLVFNQLLNH